MDKNKIQMLPEQQLEKNVEKVITDVYVKTNIKGSYNPKIKAIILLSGQKDSPPPNNRRY